MPSVPTILLTPDNTDGSISIAITNPSTNPDYNDVWKYKASESLSSAIKIGASVRADGVFADYTCGSDIPYNYFVRAVDSGGATADSAIASSSVTLSLLHVHAVTKISRTSNKTGNQVRLTNLMPESLLRARTSEARILGGKDKPDIGTGGITEGTLSFTARLSDRADVTAMRALYRLGQTLCWRDQVGNVFYGVAESLPPSFHALRTDIPFTVKENDYSPAITSNTILAASVEVLLKADGFGLLGVNGQRIRLAG